MNQDGLVDSRSPSVHLDSVHDVSHLSDAVCLQAVVMGCQNVKTFFHDFMLFFLNPQTYFSGQLTYL